MLDRGCTAATDSSVMAETKVPSMPNTVKNECRLRVRRNGTVSECDMTHVWVEYWG